MNSIARSLEKLSGREPPEIEAKAAPIALHPDIIAPAEAVRIREEA